MDPKERELRQRLAEKLSESRKALEAGNMEEARSAKNQAEEVRKQLDLHMELRELDLPAVPTPGPAVPTPGNPSPEERDLAKYDQEYRRIFLKVMRNKDLTSEERSFGEERAAQYRAMTGLTDADGGLVIPQDIQTMINTLKRQYPALEQYVYHIPTSTRSGSRVLEKLIDIVPFAVIDEMGTINDDTNTPQFSKVTYNLTGRGGILPISNTLLQDSDQNLVNYLAGWISKKSVVTTNSLIIPKFANLTTKTLHTFEDIKHVLNVDLDPLISVGASILTNQDGYNWLDQQKDGYGRPLLQPDPTNSTRKMLFGCTVAVLSNRFFKSTTDTTVTPNVTTAPMVIGDLKEAIVHFDRDAYEVASTNVGGDAFKRNSTDVRVIQREDVQMWDTGAAIYGELVIS